MRCAACGRQSPVRHGIWEAMGAHRAQRSLAQLANSVPPEPQLYEAIWRRTAARRFSRGLVDLQRELQELNDAIEPQPGQVMIDVGCSEGLFARTLAARGAVVLAVDHSRSFLRQAQRRARRDAVTVWPVRALAQYLPVADGSVDAVVIGGSLNEIGDRRMALAEARRVLAPGARVFSTSLVVASTPAGRTLQRALTVTGITFPTLAATTALFEEVGLSVSDVRCDGILVRVRARVP